MKDFIIFSPPYDERIGGFVALHKLCDLINKAGRKAWIFPYFDEAEGRASTDALIDYIDAALPWYRSAYPAPASLDCPLIPSAAILRDLDNTVVIYPEVIAGNPLQARHIVRWLLHDPGYHTGKIDYGTDELLVRYSHATRAIELPDSCTAEQILMVFHLPDEYLGALPERHTRSGTAYCLRKGKGRQIVHDTRDSILIDGKSNREIAEIFRRVETFISYDTRTAYCWLAALCGCDSVVIPEEGIAESMWAPDPNEFVGVAYGFENLEKARNERPLLLEKIRRDSEESLINTINFLSEADAFFG